MLKQKCPPLATNEGTGRSRKPSQDYTAPVCRLHGWRITSRFPAGCPLASASPLAEVHRIQVRGWELLAPRNHARHASGLTLLQQYETCYECVGRLIAHPLIVSLRTAAPSSPEPSKVPPATPPTCTKPVRSPGSIPVSSRRLPTRGKVGSR